MKPCRPFQVEHYYVIVLTARTRYVNLHTNRSGSKSRQTIEVKNSGPTIEKENLKQIFDPLKRGLGQDNRDEVFTGT